MCRIAGIIHPRYSSQELETWIGSMCVLLKHGGPDSGGSYTFPENNLVLGNRRLALQDLSDAGRQPMHYQDRYTITYNGELYNFPELKEELTGLGHVFHNDTDTEVILAAFAQWHTRSFAKFNGMFAFALWDNHEKQLFIARDASGMKPLYYSCHTGGLVFASEVRALKVVPYLSEENRNWPVYLMAYGHIPEPVTTLMHVQPLRKGCFLQYDARSGKYSYQSFAHYSYTGQVTDRDEAVKSVRSIASAAVNRHLIADAPIGVFLSGGLDSSVIARVSSDVGKSRLNTFSLYFEEESYSEKKYQDLVLERIECNAYQHLLTENEFHGFFPQILSGMDMPGCDGINTWFISKYARDRGLKAVLSGIGGDELFGGYPSFSRMIYASNLQKVPVFGINNGRTSGFKQINRMSYLKLGGIKGIYLFLRGHFAPVQIARQLNTSETEVWKILEELPVFNDISVLKPGNQASWMEFNMYMQNQLLRDADVMGMANGVEIRVPFLDDELIRYVMKIDAGVKYEGRLKKQLLIDAFANDLPDAIWKRPKMGFSFPFAKWLRNSSFMGDIVASADNATRANHEKFLNGKLHWSQMLSLLLLHFHNSKEQVCPA